MTKAVFLDRDGVINEVLTSKVKFVNQPKDLYLLKGVPEAIAAICEAGFKVFVVTNQGGVGLGFMKESMLVRIHEKMKAEIEQAGGEITDIAYCPHKPKAGCPCRKPEARLITDLANKYDIDLSNSMMVGDREPDIEAGKKAGVKSTIFIGLEEDNQFGADVVFPDLISAVPWIIGEN